LSEPIPEESPRLSSIFKASFFDLQVRCDYSVQSYKK
jgi:hypothetical protein